VADGREMVGHAKEMMINTEKMMGDDRPIIFSIVPNVGVSTNLNHCFYNVHLTHHKKKSFQTLVTPKVTVFQTLDTPKNLNPPSSSFTFEI
jgi:hypothetical protein